MEAHAYAADVITDSGVKPCILALFLVLSAFLAVRQYMHEDTRLDDLGQKKL